MKIHKTSHNRPDIVDRIKKLKLGSLLDDIYNKGILDYVVAFCYIIEDQKRRLPNSHIRLSLKKYALKIFL